MDNLPIANAPEIPDPGNARGWAADQTPALPPDAEQSSKRQRSRELRTLLTDPKPEPPKTQAILDGRIQTDLNNAALSPIIRDLVTRVGEFPRTQQNTSTSANLALTEANTYMERLSARNSAPEQQAQLDASLRSDHQSALNMRRAQHVQSSQSQQHPAEGATQGLLQTEYTLRGHRNELHRLRTRPMFGRGCLGNGSNIRTNDPSLSSRDASSSTQSVFCGSPRTQSRMG